MDISQIKEKLAERGYILGALIQESLSAQVFLGHVLPIGERGEHAVTKCVIKLTDIDKLGDTFENECRIHDFLSQCPHIVRKLEHFRLGVVGVIVTEAGECDLLSLGRKKAKFSCNVDLVVREMTLAVKECHEKGIVHSDIKPENFIWVDGSGVKLIDFGCSFKVRKELVMRNYNLGTVEYRAPELFGMFGPGKFDLFKSDVWSLGVAIYAFMTGTWPYNKHHAKKMQLGENPFLHEFDLLETISATKYLTSRQKDFVSRALAIDPFFRASSLQLSQHSYISGSYPNLLPLNAQIVPEFYESPQDVSQDDNSEQIDPVLQRNQVRRMFGGITGLKYYVKEFINSRTSAHA